MNSKHSEKLSILYICGYAEGIVGGVQTVVPQYFANISRYARVYVYNFKDCKYQTEGKYIQIRDKRELYCKLKKIDIVVFHEVYYMKYFSFAKKITDFNIPYIVIPHGSLTTGAQTQKKFLKKLVNILWATKFIANAKCIQFLSEGEKKSSRCKGTDSCVISNGIESANQFKSDWNTVKVGLNLIFIGRLSIYYKGIDILLDACRFIRKEMVQKQINLDIYGVDFENGKKFIENKILEYSLHDIVRLHDGIFGQEKINRLMASDVFIQTSRFEGQPMGILEALGMGLPAIVTSGTTFGELIKSNDCGIFVETEAKDIAQGILRLEHEKDRLVEMSKNAIKLINENYLWNKVAKRTIDIYTELCKTC